MKSLNDNQNGSLNGNNNGNFSRLSVSQAGDSTEAVRYSVPDPGESYQEISEPTHRVSSEKTKTSHLKVPHWSHARIIAGAVILIGLAVGGAYFGPNIASAVNPATTVTPAATLASVVVSSPLVRDIEPQLQFLGQFSAVDSVELRAQVGGTLTSIGFKDGDIVKQGDLLFTIDPTPYSIKLAHAQALVEAAKARVALAGSELTRAKTLAQSGAFSAEEVESRTSEQLSAQAALDDAQAAVRDAQFDLDHCQIAAPFTGRIGTHLTSVGNLIAGSRAATSPTTLLATIVSIDPVWVNFDMSESDYLTFLHARAKQPGPLADKVVVALGDENSFKREGTLDFVDNTLDRSSGTIHARATIPNKDFLLTPGGFARVRVTLGTSEPALLVPDASIFNDQSNHVVMTVDADNTVVPRVVELGDMRNGLRVIRSGLSATDRVIISGAILAKPGAKVSPSNGSIKERPDQLAAVNP
jgi:membrane fusion protein, multidrug efflux system